MAITGRHVAGRRWLILIFADHHVLKLAGISLAMGQQDCPATLPECTKLWEPRVTVPCQWALEPSLGEWGTAVSLSPPSYHPFPRPTRKRSPNRLFPELPLLSALRSRGPDHRQLASTIVLHSPQPTTVPYRNREVSRGNVPLLSSAVI